MGNGGLVAVRCATAGSTTVNRDPKRVRMAYPAARRSRADFAATSICRTDTRTALLASGMTAPSRVSVPGVSRQPFRALLHPWLPSAAPPGLRQEEPGHSEGGDA